MKHSSSSRPSERPRACRDQIVTLEDLDNLQQDLLLKIRHLLLEFSSSFTSAKSWLKTGEVRAILGRSRGTLHTFRANGTLPFVKMGGSILYSAEAIEEVLQERMASRKKQF